MTTIDHARLRELAEKASGRPPEGSRDPHKWAEYVKADHLLHDILTPRTVLALLGEIERLRGESDWEYGVSWVDVAGRVFKPAENAWDARVEVRRMSAGDPYPEDNYVVRRRKAGQWVRVPDDTTPKENDDDRW